MAGAGGPKILERLSQLQVKALGSPAEAVIQAKAELFRSVQGDAQPSPIRNFGVLEIQALKSGAHIAHSGEADGAQPPEKRNPLSPLNDDLVLATVAPGI